ncbi:MAG: FAD-dependent oxidoreductase [Actinomycetota bacterium]|nr:FAD-dependent oxidoreductase [Actinomycetota bacterium]
MSTAPSHPTLRSPVSLGPLELRNRVVSTSHQTGLVHDHLPTADLVAYHEARARGGVGAIFLEATAMHASGLLTAHTIGGFLPEIVPEYQRLGEAIRAHGARFLVQLLHGGREQISSAPKAPAVAPSAVPSLRFKAEPRAMTPAEIGELIAGYGIAAALAHEGGADGLELSMAHGYLPSQFFSTLTNRRTDSYDASWQGRLRFAREILGAVRSQASTAMAVGVRISADELVLEGLGAEQCAEIARELWDSGLIDFISLALGHSASPSASTWIAPPPPAARSAISEPAATIRAAVPEACLIATTRVVDLDAAEELLSSGCADLVGMTRALIADPELLEKSASGRTDEVIECIGCNQSCIGHYHAGVPIGCAVNPRTGRERGLGTPRIDFAGRGARRRRSGQRVFVIGAGPAGIAAALEAAAAGDEVTVVEQDEDIGGQLRLAGRAPAHLELWERYRRSTLARMRAAGIDLQLGVAAGSGTASEYDVVVLASGAKPYRPPLSSSLSITVIDAWEAIKGPSDVDGPALLADWGGGWDGLDAAERLAGAGVEVTLACAAPTVGETIHQYQRNLYLARLDELGVVIAHHTELAIEGGEPKLRHIFSGRSEALPQAATLVLAQGRVPADELWAELEEHPRALRAGDVLGPRTLEEAVLEGTMAVAR